MNETKKFKLLKFPKKEKQVDQSQLVKDPMQFLNYIANMLNASPNKNAYELTVVIKEKQKVVNIFSMSDSIAIMNMDLDKAKKFLMEKN